MGGIIKLIKNLFSGIFSFVGGIFGIGKSGYFMELDEAKLESVKAKASEAKDAIVENAKSAVATVEAAAKSTADSVAKTADSVAESVKETVATTEQNGKTTVKSAEETGKAAAKSLKAKSKKAEPAPATAESNGSTNGTTPPVPANAQNVPEPTVNFASEYLTPKPTNTRRRPGANMNSYLEMAKNVKTPNN